MVWRIVPGEPCRRSMVASHSRAGSSMEIIRGDIVVVDRAGDIVPGIVRG